MDHTIVFKLKKNSIHTLGMNQIMHVSQNVSIRWEMNFYDKNTFKGKGITEHN
jgi:hypothetical protein